MTTLAKLRIKVNKLEKDVKAVKEELLKAIENLNKKD